MALSHSSGGGKRRGGFGGAPDLALGAQHGDVGPRVVEALLRVGLRVDQALQLVEVCALWGELAKLVEPEING